MTTGESAWLEDLGIADRVGTPDIALRREAVEGVPHASAMRDAFDAKVDALLSIQDVPTVAFAVRDRFNREEVDGLHKALWNQGLASVLLVHLPTEVRVFSLWARPISPDQQSLAAGDRRLVETLQLASEELLRAREVVPAVESGHYFRQHREHFNRETRVDATLLANLKETRRRLVAQQVPDDVARALILQVVFISYLEDRGIIDEEDFRRGVGGKYHSLLDVLAECNPDALKRLISYLKKTFNGDVFFAPGVFENGGEPVSLVSQCLAPLAEFREGWGDMATRQARFWGYDFRFIPVELISAIYDRFLNEDDKSRRESGAYFTPRFLADLVVDQVWDSLPPAIRSGEFTVLDPSCGSAIFLVRMFKKIVEDHRRPHGRPPDWATLRSCLGRLHGWDIQDSALRIGIFSLYVALLEQVHPPAIRALKAEGKVLPRLLGKTLCCRDFFEEREPELRFDVIVGNPPWVSRNSNRTATALAWCKRRGRPVPSNEIAWAFVWKAAEHLETDGRVALLLPAMGILLNHSNEANEARRRWLEGIELLRLVNFADVCFQLFDGADRPTILALYRMDPGPGRDYDVEYWVPKAHRLLGSTRLLVIPSADRAVVRMSAARTDPAIWKKRMWATNRDLKLLAWLGELPKLGQTLCTYAQAKRSAPAASQWVIGQGFKPYHPESQSEKQRADFDFEESVTLLPFLPASNFRAWVLPLVPSSQWPEAKVHRKGFVDGFLGPHILIPQGVVRDEGFIRAAYVQESLCFQHSIQAIRFPTGEESTAKVLTAVLNSSLAAWYYFHTSANFGADRAKVHEEQLLDLPFPRWHESTNVTLAQRAEEHLVRIVDQMLARKEELFTRAEWLDECISQVNSLVFDYYGLTEEERVLVSDAVTWVIPSMQPRKEAITKLMQNARPEDRRLYCQTLVEALRAWLRPGTDVHARLIEGSAGVAVIELGLGRQSADLQVTEAREDLDVALRRIMQQLPVSMSRNVELHPDLKVFIDDSLYLVKPLSSRYWLPSTALNDADGVIADLLSAEARAWRTTEHERRR